LRYSSKTAWTMRQVDREQVKAHRALKAFFYCLEPLPCGGNCSVTPITVSFGNPHALRNLEGVQPAGEYVVYQWLRVNRKTVKVVHRQLVTSPAVFVVQRLRFRNPVANARHAGGRKLISVRVL
jgi:hypothetical protein